MTTFSVGDIVLLYRHWGYIEKIEGELLYIQWFDWPHIKAKQYHFDGYAHLLHKMS